MWYPIYIGPKDWDEANRRIDAIIAEVEWLRAKRAYSRLERFGA